MFLFCWLNTLLGKFEKESCHAVWQDETCIQLRPWKVDKAGFQSLPVMSLLSKPAKLWASLPSLMPGNDQTHLAGVDRGHEQTLAQRKLRKPGALSSPCPAEASGLGGPRCRSHPALPLAVLLASCWNSGPVVLAYLLTSFLFFLVWSCSFSQQQDREN